MIPTIITWLCYFYAAVGIVVTAIEFVRGVREIREPRLHFVLVWAAMMGVGWPVWAGLEWQKWHDAREFERRYGRRRNRPRRWE